MSRFNLTLPNSLKKETSSLNSTFTANMMKTLEEEFEFDDDLSIHIDDCSSVDDTPVLKSSHSTALTCGSLEFSDLLEHSEAGEPVSSFHTSYDLGIELGKGAFGSVMQCSLKSSGSCELLAVKRVAWDKYNEEEIEVLEMLEDCPHIVKVEDVIHDFDESFIVMKELQGGDLLGRIGKKVVYTEAEAKVLFATVLETVKFCHERGVAHCDIKSENILLVHKDDDTTIQLADFGLAKIFRSPGGQKERLYTMDGSAEYSAPEVFNRDEDDEDGYDERCDIWSCGVLLYLLLGGYPPFDGETPFETIRKVGQGKFKFHNKYWKGITLEAKILIAKMLQVNPDNRCTLDEALASPWFKNQ